MNRFKLIASISIIATQMYAVEPLLNEVNKKHQNALLIVGDESGLNVNSPSLLAKNLKKLDELVNKQSIKRSKIRSIEFLTFDETIQSISKVKENRGAKLFRVAKPLLERFTNELKQARSSKKSKDVIGALKHLQILIKQQYSNHYDQIVVVILSNLRDSYRAKEEFISLKPLKFSNTTLHILAASGLEAIGANSTQKQVAENQIIDYYTKKLQATKTNILTIY